MFSKTFSILTLFVLVAVEATNAELNECNKISLRVLSSLAKSIAQISEHLGKCSDVIDEPSESVEEVIEEVVEKAVEKAIDLAVDLAVDNLEDGKQYYLKSVDGRFAVVVLNYTRYDYGGVGYMRQIEKTNATKFTAKQIDVNLFRFSADGNNMDECRGCLSDFMFISDTQTDYNKRSDTVIFCPNNGRLTYWKLHSSRNAKQFSLQVDLGYLTYNITALNDYQLTLSSVPESKFEFIKV